MEMNFTDKNFLTEVEEYTGNLLQKKEDVKKIIELVGAEKKEEEFEKLVFTAKYISGMMRVLKNAPGIPEVSSIDHVRKDLNENMKKGIEQLKEIITFGSESVGDYFNRMYFDLSTQNFINITQLFSDLELVKKYMNHLKRQS
jgi:hypothetical protein